MRGRILLLACLLATASPAIGAPTGLLPQPDLRFRNLSLEDGLSQSSVYALLQDRQGFVWLATQDGLNRYDGYGFLTYRQDPDDPSGLSSSYIRCLLQDRAGALWIGTDRGLNRLEPVSGAFTTFRHSPDDASSLSHDFVYALHEDQDGDLWVGTENGLNRFEARSGSFSRFRFEPRADGTPGGHTILSLVSDHQGAIWLGSADGASRFDPRSVGQDGPAFEQVGERLRQTSVFALRQGSDGSMWVGSDAGLYRYAPPTGSLERVALPGERSGATSGILIRSLYEDRKGVVWVGTRGGLAALDPRSGEAVRYQADPTEETSLGSDYVRAILEDRSGLLWFGTDGVGVSIYDPLRNAFRHHRARASRPGSLADEMIFSVREDTRGRLWVGTWQGGLNRSDDGGRSFTSLLAASTPGLDHDAVYAIEEDRDGFVWLGTEAGGLSRYDPESGRFRSFRHEPGDPQSLGEDSILSLLVDSQDDLWVGTWSAGVNRCRRRTMRCERFRHDPEDPRSLSDNTIFSLLEDRQGDLWVGTEAGGVNRRRREADGFDRFRHDPADPGSLSDDGVMAIHQDAAGTIWVGTYAGGLNRFDETSRRFAHYTMRDGLPSNVVYGILEDDAGHLWLSTNGGLSRFDPGTETFRNFDAGDGTLSNEFNSGAFHGSPTGRLFFGSIAGLVSFSPADLLGTGATPPVAISSFQRLGRSPGRASVGAGGAAIELAYEEPISLELAVLDYRRPRKNRFAYTLGDADGDWIDLGTKRDITLTSLSPGRHTLLVRGASSEGVWNETGIAVDLLVAPPYWMTLWFRLLVAGLLMSLGLAWHRQRVRSIAGHNRQLQVINMRLERQIARRREVEAALRQKDLELGLALAGARTGTWSWRTAEDRIEGSPQAVQILGLGEEDLSGSYQHFLDLVHPEDRETVEREMRQALETGGAYDLEHRIRRPDGSSRWIRGRGRVTGDETRRDRRISGVVTDVTLRKEAESEREALIRQLEARNAELEQFAYTVSHDMKAPLVTIRGFLGLARRDAETKKLAELGRDLGHIGKAAETMTELIQGLLRLSTVGRVENPHEPVDLRRVAEEAVALLEGSIRHCGARVELSLDGTQVSGDRLRLLELLLNLIENAVKFMGDQAEPKIEFGTEKRGDEVLCHVRDNGIGIAPALHEKIFELFTRLDPQTDGTGVGLSLVKRIVEEHGGRVWVESDPPRPGSTFWFTLPSAG